MGEKTQAEFATNAHGKDQMLYLYLFVYLIKYLFHIWFIFLMQAVNV